MVSAPTRTEVLTLFRSLMRTARGFNDYNLREYTKRRAVDAFRHNRRLSDPAEATAAFSDGKSQLAVAKRQANVYSLFSSLASRVCWKFTGRNNTIYVGYFHHPY